MKNEKIWQKTLNESEKVEYEFSVAKGYKRFVLVMSIFWGALTFGVFFVIGMIYRWHLKFNAYALTEKRILIHTGWLSTKSTSISYDKIIEISVSESFINRKFTNSGNLVIKTSGIGHDIILKYIETPYEVKKMIDRLSHRA